MHQKRSSSFRLAGLTGMLLLAPLAFAQITTVAPGSISGTGLITFDDVLGGSPGTNYDTIFESDGATFGERFLGQTLGFSGDSDVLSGTPSGPLALVAGAANQNLVVLDNNGTQVLAGLGPVGFPNFDAIGEGSFAVLFDFDQSEFGFDLVGGDGGSATVDFFRRDGSLIDSIMLSGITSNSYAFSRDGGINDIAGLSIWNSDPAGIGFDNLRHDVPGIPGPGPTGAVPEPSTYGLIAAAALLGIAAWRRRRR